MSNLIVSFENTNSNKNLSELQVPIAFLIDISQYKNKSIEQANERIIDSLEVFTILDIVYSKVLVTSKVISKDHLKENVYRICIDIDISQYEKVNPDLLLNIASINMRFMNDKHDEKVIIMQIVKEKNVFYKNIIL